jgi:hypothetical protein
MGLGWFYQNPHIIPRGLIDSRWLVHMLWVWGCSYCVVVYCLIVVCWSSFDLLLLLLVIMLSSFVIVVGHHALIICYCCWPSSPSITCFNCLLAFILSYLAIVDLQILPWCYWLLSGLHTVWYCWSSFCFIYCYYWP